jgi:hypothetical protein
MVITTYQYKKGNYVVLLIKLKKEKEKKKETSLKHKKQ